jgi:diguanylate cyclase (GGDEF)-like protein/PAS domain S-box-containing protein
MAHIKYPLVAFAALICAAAALTFLHAYTRAADDTPARRPYWLLLTGLCAATPMWTAHFLLLMAYNTPVAAGFSAAKTVAALLPTAAVAMAGLAWGLSGPPPWAATVGGAAVGLAVGVMHFCGVDAMIAPLPVGRSGLLLAAGLLVSAGLGAAAMTAYHRMRNAKGEWLTIGLLTAAVCGGEVMMVGSLHIARDTTGVVPAASMAGTPMAYLVAVTTALSMVIGRGVLMLHGQKQGDASRDLQHQHDVLKQREEELRTQNVRFEAALKSLTQGVCVFDIDQRLVICNEPYLRMYNLSADDVKPGVTLREILELRIATGSCGAPTPQGFFDERFNAVASNRSEVVTHRLPDGRIIDLAHYPIPGGGWVATHSDVTERRIMEAALERYTSELEHQNRLLHQREEELRVQNERLDAALTNMAQGLAMFDADERLVLANARYGEIYGHTPEEMAKGTTLRQLIEFRLARGVYPGATIDQVLAAMRKRVASGSVSHLASNLGDGRVLSVSIKPRPVGGWVVTLQDVTERERLNARLGEQNDLLKLHEEKLRTQNLQLDAALNNMVQGLAMFDADLRLVLANARYGEIYGLTVEQLKPGTSLREIIEYRVAQGYNPGKTVDQIMQALLDRSDGTKATHYTSAIGDGRYVSVSMQAMADGCAVTTHQDITEQRRSEAKIAHMALHDALTGLPNRVLLNERIEHALGRIKRGEIVATHLLDLDHFKNVNDTLGHSTGDKLLKMVGDRLRTLLRETDTVARMGGDEFAIVQVGIAQPADATSLAHRVIEVVSEPYEIDGQQVIIGTSVGIAVGPADGLTPDQLMRNADLALYRAKGDGRGAFCFFEPEMDAQMQLRRAMEYDLRKALPAGEFELHYQPIVSLKTDTVSGFEALIRWHHPERGMVPPGKFIPLAEEIGFINPLGEWTIREACATAVKWPEHITVAVNLSPAQFRAPGLVQTVVSALASSGLAAERLELEITETILLEDSESTLVTLYQLRELGVRIAMDDFGTGYSSLSYLQSFPFDRIKIDQTFIQDITDGLGSLNIVRAVAALASGLGMATTAEGVETQEQLEIIKTEGCTEMQGFLFGRAQPAEEIERKYFSKPVKAKGKAGKAKPGAQSAA